MAKRVKVDDEFRTLLAVLTDDERRQLEDNVVREGCRDALVVWDSPNGLILLDGHNRLEICEAHDIAYEVTSQNGIANREEAKLWIINNQLGRRNLNDYQRTRLELQKKPLIAARAKEQQGTRTDIPSTLTEGLTPIDTREEIARKADVSTGTVHKVAKILDKADDETKAQLERGETSINAAYQQIRREEKEGKREERRGGNREKVAATQSLADLNGVFATRRRR
jgi:hypothetical protein